MFQFMSDALTQLTGLRLSQEAIDLFYKTGGFVGAEPIDLRPLFESGHSNAVRLAALRWKISPDQVLLHVKQNLP
jgi:hypothetical protein